MNALSSARGASGRLSGSLLRQAATNAWKSAPHRSGWSSVGGGRDGIRKSTRTAGVTSKSGGSICASSIAVMPSDQMSVRWSYWPASIISGLIHIGAARCGRG
eukprot:5175672-Prymnesium_polylepis.1